MKPFQLQSYYELLEVPVSASTEQIRRSYERLIEMYADDQVALYGLTDTTSATALRTKLHEAVEVLTDDDLRTLYDAELGLPPRQKPAPRGDDDEQPAQLAMNDLLTGADRALQSTHPYVPFSYVSTEPPAPPPAPVAVAVAVPPPAVVPPPVPVLPDATPTPPPPPAVTTPSPSPAPLPPIVEAAALAPAPSAPPALVASAPPPRPSPGQAPELAESAAIAVAESQLAKVASVVEQREARASAPRPKPPDLPPDAEFNGELLRKVRTAMGITVQQIAEKTRISARHIEAIEADKYAALPAAVYLRGILMNVARELGLDGLRVAKSYLALAEKAKG